MKIEQDILEILERCRIEGNTLFLPDEQLDRTTYQKVNKCLENIGGKWNRKAKGHIFDHDPTEGLENMIMTGQASDFKKVFQFFPTPRAVAEQMCRLAELKRDSVVLEPSIGKGDLADVVLEYGYVGENQDGQKVSVVELVSVELNHDMSRYLEGKPYKSFVGVDFLTLAYTPSREDLLGYKNFTHVIMNPPFAKQQDLDHIRAAYEMLKPGGILVTVATTSWQWRENKKAVEFREWLNGLDYEVIEVPAGAFKESGTMIPTVIIKIRREGILESQPTKASKPKVPTAAKLNPTGGFNMIQNIELDRIIPHPNNPRQALGDLTELVDSIKAVGIMQNLTVVPCTISEPEVSSRETPVVSGMFGTSGIEHFSGYKIVIGHRQFAAAKLAGLAEVPCVKVQMDERTQIATMLLENMQRSDLTVYEQAQGIQMMLDLGENTDTISEKTGLSQSTIRRRVKLLDLKPDTFKVVDARGVSLADYAELDKIKDITLKNEVAQHLGTSNFNWQLRQAVEKEELVAKYNEIIAELKEVAVKLNSKDEAEDLNYITYCNGAMWSLNSFPIPEATASDEDINYYFLTNDEEQEIWLYSDQSIDEEDESEEEDPAEVEKQLRCEKLKELNYKAYKMRLDFASTVKDRQPKGAKTIEKAAALVLAKDIGRIEKGHFADFIGVDKDSIPWNRYGNEKAAETFSEAKDRVFSEMKPLELLFVATYLRLESQVGAPYNRDARHSYEENIINIYGFLCELGYQMSDEESAFIDGTHELYSPIESV